MKNVLPIQLKFMTLLLLGLITMPLLLLFLGVNTQVNAQSVTEEEIEVLSIPPQEAYFIEDKTQEPFNTEESTSYPEERWDNSNTPIYPTNDGEENMDNRPTNSEGFN